MTLNDKQIIINNKGFINCYIFIKYNKAWSVLYHLKEIQDTSEKDYRLGNAPSCRNESVLKLTKRQCFKKLKFMYERFFVVGKYLNQWYGEDIFWNGQSNQIDCGNVESSWNCLYYLINNLLSFTILIDNLFKLVVNWLKQSNSISWEWAIIKMLCT